MYLGAFGLLFVAASMLALIRRRQVHWATLRDALFLLALAATFVIQLVQGADIIAQPHNPAAVNTIAILVVVSFLIGIARSWELIGGPSMGLTKEVTELVRGHQHGADTHQQQQ